MNVVLLDTLAHVTSLLASATLVVWLWLSRRRAQPLWQLGLLLLTATVATTLVGRLVSVSSFGTLRAAAWVVFLYLPIWVGTIALFQRGYLKWGLIAVAIVNASISVDAFYYEPRSIVTTHHVFSSPRISHAIRVLVIADIQMDSWSEYENDVIDRAVGENPDLVLFAGDYIQTGTREAEREIARSFVTKLKSSGLLRAKYGAFAVQGNAEATATQSEPVGVLASRSSEPDWATRVFGDSNVYAFRSSGAKVIDDLVVTGLTLEDSFAQNGLPSELEKLAAGRLHIVLGHAPDFALGRLFTGDLLVAGHTHGGQVQIPLIGPLLTFSRVPSYMAAGGMFSIENDRRKLVVSRGIGMERLEAPRLRFFCRPELVVIDIKPEGHKKR